MKQRGRFAVGAAVVLATVSASGIVLAATRTPNSSAAMSAKQSFAAAVQSQLAQNQSRPRAQKAPVSLVAPQMQPACVTLSLPFGAGIHVGGQGGPFGSASNFAATGSWAGIDPGSGRAYAVWSGTEGSATGAVGTPAVAVYTQTLTGDRCGVDQTLVGIFAEPTADGSLTIAAVSGAAITLATPSGATFIFNIESDTFAAA